MTKKARNFSTKMSHSKFMSAIMTDAFDDFDILEYNKLIREERKERNVTNHVRRAKEKRGRHI